MRNIAEERAAYFRECESWIRTPFHDKIGKKGIGTDCLGYIASAAWNARVVDAPVRIPNYMPDQNLHWRDRSKPPEQTYLMHLEPYMAEVPPPHLRAPKMSDIVIWQMAWIYYHTAVVEDWPRIIHAYKQMREVARDDVVRNVHLSHVGEEGTDYGKPRRFKILVFKGWLADEPRHRPCWPLDESEWAP